MEKKGLEAVTENLIFMILNLIFFAALLVFIVRASTGAAYYEQVYAKQIALILDSAKPGMKITIDLAPLIKVAKKNKVSLPLEEIVNLKEKQKVTVRASKKQYIFVYFSSLDFESYYNDEEGTLRLEFSGEN